MIEIQMILKNEFGEFVGRKVSIELDKYDGFVKLSKNFYLSGFELTCEDGTFMVFPPEIVKKSILIIKTKKDVQEQV
jgi:hypothetical protein